LFGTIPISRERSGAESAGLAYELAPPASPGGAWTEVVLHSFGNQNDVNSPTGTLLLGSGGALYGVTGGATSGGAVFQLKPPAADGTHWSEASLHTFTGSGGDGAGPNTTPVPGPHKALYGTTEAVRTAYRLLPPAEEGGTWTEELLYVFEGVTPMGALAVGQDATIYGGTAGTIYELAPPAAPGGAWTQTILYTFGTQSGDASLPNGVVLGPNGVLYGTAMGDASPKRCTSGCGTVFQPTPPAEEGGAWTETILHSFAGNPAGDGSQPNSLVLAPSGALYGTTWTGGSPGAGSFGTIFEMVPPSSPGGEWTEVILYRFTGGADGSAPNAVTLGPDGNLYGTTFIGGVSKDGTRNQGTVFQFVLQ
jgi:hypothetical protein